MTLSPDECYRAICSRDARFDGVIYVGVSSTGIYCRPVCPVKEPKRENCTFFNSAAAAEKAGYRPCLRCRPELAPGRASIDAVGRLAAQAASRIEDGALADASLEELAQELGVSSRHMRRAVEKEFGVTPVELAQTHKLLLAKRLLTDTGLEVGEIAIASGFGSVRRMNALFRDRYRLSPTQLRKGSRAPKDTLACSVRVKPPFDWTWALQYLGGRAFSGVEQVEGATYRRTVQIGSVTGWIAAQYRPEHCLLELQMSPGLATVLPRVMARAKRLFDTQADSELIARHLGELAVARPGVRVPGCFSGFELAVRAILGQRISVRAATTLAGRYAQRFGECAETPYPGLERLSPTPERIAVAEPAELASLGMPLSRATAIVSLAQAVVAGLRLRPGVDVRETTAALKAVPGIGEWTAQYIAMRALRWPDAFPHSDLGILQALDLKNQREALKQAEQWRPWRAYAAMQLWRSLEDK